MEPMPWYYVYSPKYEVFHHILHSSVTGGFEIHPCFFPQAAFSNTYSPDGSHFMAGNCVKYETLVLVLEKHKGRHFLMTDVDMFVSDSVKFREYLESYKQYDITYMRESKESDMMMAGFVMIKSTEATIAFYKYILEKLKADPKDNDLTCINREIHRFEGTVGLFGADSFFLANHYTPMEPYLMIQFTCSQDTYEKNLFEKLIFAALFFDLEVLESYIPSDVWETLLWFFQKESPGHHLALLAARYKPSKMDLK